MINLHPAAPNGPDGTWQEVIWKLIEQRADHSGVKIHLVTEELDRGPTIAYCRYPIHSPAFDATSGEKQTGLPPTASVSVTGKIWPYSRQ